VHIIIILKYVHIALSIRLLRNVGLPFTFFCFQQASGRSCKGLGIQDCEGLPGDIDRLVNNK